MFECDVPLPSAGSPLSASSPTSTVLSGRSDSLLSVLPRFGSRRSAIPHVAWVRFVSPVATSGRTTDLELVTRSRCRILHVETTGPPRFPGNPNIHLLMFFDPGRTTTTNHNAAVARLPLKRKRKLQREILFRGSIAWLLDSLCTLRSDGYPNTTQHSLPAAGQALPGEIVSLGSSERFQIMTS